MTAPLDLSMPSYRGAYHFAREAAWASARAAGRNVPGKADKPAGDAVLARLLWLVSSDEGGFDGASDAQLMERAGRYGLSATVVGEALWTACVWPTAERVAA